MEEASFLTSFAEDEALGASLPSPTFGLPSSVESTDERTMNFQGKKDI